MRTLSRAVCLLSCLALWQLSCISGGTPLAIEPHLQPMLEQPDPGSVRLGVMPFVDARMPEAKLEGRPPLRIQGLEFGRRGEVRTGDSSFSTPPVVGARADVIATLARSGLFSEVKPTRDHFPDDVDLLLQVDLNDFGAARFESVGIHPFRLGWLRRESGDPTGFVRLTYRVHDAAGVVTHGNIVAEHTSMGQPLPQAALDALAVASESLARELHKRVIKREYTRVSVKVADACGLGRSRVRGLLSQVSEVFEREAGVRLDASVEPWPSSDSHARLALALDAMRVRYAESDGIVLALVPDEDTGESLLGIRNVGLARTFDRYAVVGCSEQGKAPVVTVVHELAHLFGAVHVRDRSSVMHPSFEFDGRFFDPLNRRVLMATRERSFREPLSQETARRVRRLYVAASHADDCCDPEDLDAALQALGSASTGP